MESIYCSFPKCDRKARYGGHCPAHRRQFTTNKELKPLKAWYGKNPTFIERLYRSFKVDVDTGCWVWYRYIDPEGYGVLVVDRKNVRAHRATYEFFRDPIPEGLVIDHLCRNRSCVNPNHLEVVTPKVNSLRGIGFARSNKDKTHCDNGHEFNERNTYYTDKNYRACRECKKLWARRYRK